MNPEASPLYTEFQRFDDEWLGRELFLYGAGELGGQAVRFLGAGAPVLGFIDGDAGKQGGEFGGRPVYALADARALAPGAKILVTSVYYAEIAPLLQAAGLAEDVDFCEFRKYMGLYYWFARGMLFLYRTDLCITQRCTLNCAACNMLRPLYKNPRHRPVGEVLGDVDAYFAQVDLVSELNLLGGEPFLHPGLPDIVRHIHSRWGNRVGDLNFLTNGTVLPSQEALAACREAGAVMVICDYSPFLPELGDRVRAFEQAVRQAGLRYWYKLPDRWVDFGFPRVHHEDMGRVREQFRQCKQTFRGLYGQRFYYCNIQSSAEQLGLFQGAPGDSVDLAAPGPGTRFDLLRMDLGYLEDGCLSFCARCDGCHPPNNNFVPVAAQAPRD